MIGKPTITNEQSNCPSQEGSIVTWQTIESAPKDGTRILLHWPTLFNEPYVGGGRWDDQVIYLHSQPFWASDYPWSNAQLRLKPPTLWMPLPEPPEKGDS